MLVLVHQNIFSFFVQLHVIKDLKNSLKQYAQQFLCGKFFFIAKLLFTVNARKKISNFFYSDFLKENILRGSDWCKLTLIFCKKIDIFCNNTYFLLQKSFLIYKCNSMLVFSIINHISLSYTIMQN